jgi:hypothetical protein
MAGQKIQSGTCDHSIKYLIKFKKGGINKCCHSRVSANVSPEKINEKKQPKANDSG